MYTKSLLILTLVVALGYQQSTTKTILRHKNIAKQGLKHETLREDPNKETKENVLDQWPVLIGVLTQPKS